ncbi:hypothetical protein [Ensifer adhaerens]|uniref:hypothetical protein n=1 Tax=Ensifer adhaerens TaxID=106592 RepID=UPI0009E900F4|nr:hypothetical protein [Ensifer adhaerens]
MKSDILARLGLAAAIAFALSNCTTTQADFRKNPAGVSKSALCRTFITNTDLNFTQELTGELARRRIDPIECVNMVQQENQAAAAVVAVALVGTAIAVCANNYCGGGYYPTRTYTGNCQYNWQRDAAGNRCGRRSAYSKPGGW